MNGSPSALIIACGALAREIAALRRANDWRGIDVKCLPPELHNRPERIPPAVQQAIRASRPDYPLIFVAYGDCGTGGRLDAVLRAEGVERLPGAHCYEAFATARVFEALSDAEPGTFYLTDFLLRHFERLVTRALGIERHPELAAQYFGNYRRLVYLAQTRDAAASERAQGIAQRMGLEFEYRFTGYGELEFSMTRLARRQQSAAWQP
jgi:hypothetical protein